jgi:hypothetical protein
VFSFASTGWRLELFHQNDERTHMSSAEKRSGAMDKGDSKGTGNVPTAEPKSMDERHSGWAVSSLELRAGLDVSDADDTVPAELFDRLFS